MKQSELKLKLVLPPELPMQHQELVHRLAGIYPPNLYASWQTPLIQETDIARAVIAYLADQKVLYSLSEIESPSVCVETILRIKQFLMDQCGKLDPGSDLAANLRAMSLACQKFLGRVFDRKEIERFGTKKTYWASWVLIILLGELQGVFGVHLATIAAPAPAGY